MNCYLCGLETRHPPYCIECDMTGRSRAAECVKQLSPGAYVLLENIDQRMAKARSKP